MSASDYKVGRGKPPKDRQYPKGKSGNSAGQPPREPLSIAKLIENAMMQKVEILENGRARKRAHYELILRQIQNTQLKKPSLRLLRIEAKYEMFARTQPIRRKSHEKRK